MKNIISVILGGGRGSRLYPLTKYRAKPAVPLAGKYRLIDIPVSNCLNSGFNRVYVLTQFLSASLHRHIANTYKFDPFSHGFVEILAAQQTVESTGWYEGTADAVRRNISYIQEDDTQEVLILSGDQLYRMDLRRIVATHRGANADMTVAVIPVRREEAGAFGIVRLNDAGRVIDFVEKPQTADALDRVQTPVEWIERKRIAARGRRFLASMGIYLFKREVLIELLNVRPAYTDFGKDVFPKSYGQHHVQAHLFDGYWEDLGTVKAYHQANLALAGERPAFDFHAPEGPIYTRMRFLPASRVRSAEVEECLISDGCLVQNGAKLSRCVIGVRSQLGPNVTMRDTVMVGADRFETPAEKLNNRTLGIPDLGIGDGSVIERAIIDKDCRIGRGVRILNHRGAEEAEEDHFVIRDGIVCIPKGVVVPDGAVI